MNISIKYLAAAAALMVAGATQAHGVPAPRHGGVVAQVNDVSYELVAKADSIALYVEDHGMPLDTNGATARVTLLSGTDKTTLMLAPAADKLEAKGTFHIDKGDKAVSVVTLAGKPAATARFEFK